MDLVGLTSYLIKSLVKDPESVSVKEFETEEEDTVLIEVMISNDDLGKVIGKDGRIINAIRTLVQASSYINDNKKIKINVDSY